MSSDIGVNIAGILHDKLDCGYVRIQRQVNGGIVNKAVVVDTGNQGKLFVKYSNPENFRRNKLEIYRGSWCHSTPKPIKVISGPSGGALFVMEYIENLNTVTNSWAELGTRVAKMHKNNLDKLYKTKQEENSVHCIKSEEPVSHFGFHTTSYAGPVFHTPAVWCHKWEEYFARYMLKPQVDQIIERTGNCELGEIWSELSLHLHKIYRDIDVQPSLTHGDFCTLNIGQVKDEPVVYDPCSLYAPSEQDFTILEMEDNFDPEFYKSYYSILPKQIKNYELRSKARILFALCLISNIREETNCTGDAIKLAKELLISLKML